MKTYNPRAGHHISDAIREAITLANDSQETVSMTFNDVPLTFAPGDDAATALEAWHAEMDRRAEAYRASPAGQAAAEQQREAERLAAVAEAEGVLPFALKDPEGWAKAVEVNDDPYGSCCIRYAARWANYMDREITGGKALKDIAQATSSAADLEGITGFMYGAAVSLLAQVWVHGDELRRWHNLKTQIGTEGERANETGSTLNPALLSIGP